MTTNQILLGVGLTVALAVGSQVLASRLRIPATILLLPAGFTACAITTADGTASADGNLLFLVRADGRLAPVTRSGPPEREPGHSMVVLTARPAG